MKTTLVALVVFSLSVAAGCGSSGSSGTGSGGSSGTGSGGNTDAGTGGTSGAAGTAGTGGPVMYTLTVQNYLSWCDVTENGTKYAASVPPAMSFAPGTVVNLNAVPNFIFVWGYWTGTDGDTSATHDMNMTTTVTMTSDKTILACCPDPPPAAATCP
jgi:hypothetical protein